MEKSTNNSYGDEEDNSCELPNFELKLFDGPPAKRFANLSERELNQLVEERAHLRCNISQLTSQ